MVAVLAESELSEIYEAIFSAMADFGVGRPEPFQALWSTADDVTIFGALGGHERGWSEVGSRLAWAASHLASATGTWAYEPISATLGADIAYTVGLERGGDRRRPASEDQVLRVTHVFRKERDGWKIVHRHADPLIQTAATFAVVPTRPDQ